VSRLPVPPLEPQWVIVDGLPVFHRTYMDAGPTADAVVHVHGFAISGTLFKAMTSYPTLERVRNLVMPTLVIAGDRDPLVRIDRAHVFAGLPNVQAVKVRGAYALNYSEPELIAPP
jgi:pimeloyl-ACP methyl ester carboxylesterase